MEEQFILRVTPSIAEKLDRLLSETASSSEEQSLDLSFSEDGRSGTFIIGNEHFPASLLDLPCVVESYKTYDDCALVKTADIGQMIMVREAGDTAPDVVEYRHGLTPPMRDARKRRFRREPYINPELVQRVEKDLLNIMAGGTVENADILSVMHIFSIVFSAQRELELLQLLANHRFACSWQKWVYIHCKNKKVGEVSLTGMQIIKDGFGSQLMSKRKTVNRTLVKRIRNLSLPPKQSLMYKKQQLMQKNLREVIQMSPRIRCNRMSYVEKW